MHTRWIVVAALFVAGPMACTPMNRMGNPFGSARFGLPKLEPVSFTAPAEGSVDPFLHAEDHLRSAAVPTSTRWDGGGGPQYHSTAPGTARVSSAPSDEPPQTWATERSAQWRPTN
ncbi:MAG: hypothetical protein ACREJB_07910 [Planctomycetaceae bacterium]